MLLPFAASEQEWISTTLIASPRWKGLTAV
jgi:hypothetical protein